MNWKLLILALVLIHFLYDLVLTFIKIRSTNNPIPANVADMYDAETYARWKEYRKEYSRLSLTFIVINFAVDMALLVFNVYAAFAGLFPDGFFWQLFAVILLEYLVGIPSHVIENYISDMVIEEKYGFNRTTLKTFIIDQIRSFLLTFGIMLGLVTAMAGLYKGLGDWVLLLFVGVMFALFIGIAFLHPIFSRMSNKFVPLEDGTLKDRLQELLTKYGYKVRAIEVMDGSKRSTKANAYFTGFGKMKTIVLYDTMLNTMTEDEICATFAHELGHGVHKDVLKGQIWIVVKLFIWTLIMWLVIKMDGIHLAFGFAEVNYGFAYCMLGVVWGMLSPLTSMGFNAYDCFCEYRADRMAVQEGYGKDLITGLKKLGF